MALDAETSQLLSDLLQNVQRAVDNGTEVATAVAELMGHKPADNAEVLAAIRALCEQARPQAPAEPAEPFDLVLSEVQYDSKDRLTSARIRRVPISK